MSPHLLDLFIKPHRLEGAVKRDTEDWIGGLIAYDREKGRRMDDFPGDEAILSNASKMMKGFDTYSGGGNVFYVRYRGGESLVIHVRPLAQRVVKPQFI